MWLVHQASQCICIRTVTVPMIQIRLCSLCPWRHFNFVKLVSLVHSCCIWFRIGTEKKVIFQDELFVFVTCYSFTVVVFFRMHRLVYLSCPQKKTDYLLFVHFSYLDRLFFHALSQNICLNKPMMQSECGNPVLSDLFLCTEKCNVVWQRLSAHSVFNHLELHIEVTSKNLIYICAHTFRI